MNKDVYDFHVVQSNAPMRWNCRDIGFYAEADACAINRPMNTTLLHRYFWFYGYLKPLAEARVRSM